MVEKRSWLKRDPSFPLDDLDRVGGQWQLARGNFHAMRQNVCHFGASVYFSGPTFPKPTPADLSTWPTAQATGRQSE